MLPQTAGKLFGCLVILALLVGCSALPPLPTPTIAPTQNRTPLPTETEVALEPTDTPTVTPTNTPTASITASATDTLIPTETDTTSPTLEPSLTNTPIDLSTATETATDTPAPPTEILEAPTLVPSATPAALLTATNTPIPTVVATLQPTSLFVTATHPVLLSTASNAPTADNSAGQGIVPTPRPLYVFIGGSTLEGQPFDSQGKPAAEFDVSSTGQTALIDQSGQMTINGLFYNGMDKNSGHRFITARWSPDGRWLAYIVETPNAEENQLQSPTTVDDGVWVVSAEPGARPRFVMRNTYVRASNDYRVAVGLNWSPDNDALLITARSGSASGLTAVLTSKGQDANNPLPELPAINSDATWIDSGHFMATIVKNGIATLVSVNRSSVGQPTALADSASLHLWIQNPVLLADGRYAFLGAPSATGKREPGSLSLYLMTPGSAPMQVSQPLPGNVLSAEWNSAHTLLLVRLTTAQGFQVKVISLDGTIADYTRYGNAHWR